MDGPLATSGIPSIAVAQVISWDVENHQIYIRLKSLQSPILACRVLIDGPADAYYVKQKPLPRGGTWGIVAFPGGDDRTPIWLGAYYSNLVNAFTSTAANPDSQMEYESHFSGEFSLLDGQGNHTTRLADGTLIIASESGEEAQTFRHVINSQQQQQRIQIQDTERNLKPPTSPFFIKLLHPSDASIIISPNGDVKITGANFPSPPSSVYEMDPNGNVTLLTAGDSNASPSQGQIKLAAAKDDPSKSAELILTPNASIRVILQANGPAGNNGQITIDGEGNVNIATLGNSNILINSDTTVKIEAPEGVTIDGSPADISLITSLFITTLNAIITLLNTHIHSGVQSGSGTSGPPTTTIP